MPTPDLLAPPSPSKFKFVEPATPISLEALKKTAHALAIECGLHEPIRVGEPTKENYPICGHGYTVSIREQSGKQRMGTARYSASGELRYWSMDGIVTG